MSVAISPKKQLPFIDGVEETYFWCLCGETEGGNVWIGPFKEERYAVEEGSSGHCEHTHLIMQCALPESIADKNGPCFANTPSEDRTWAIDFWREKEDSGYNITFRFDEMSSNWHDFVGDNNGHY